MATVIPGALYVTVPTALGSTSETDCYECRTGKWLYLTEIVAKDSTATANTVTLKARLNGVDYVLRSAAAVDANDGISVTFSPTIVLAAGDKIKATAGAATLHVLVTGYEGAPTGGG